MDYEYRPWGICLQRASERLLLQTLAAQDSRSSPARALRAFVPFARTPPLAPVIPQSQRWRGLVCAPFAAPDSNILGPWPITPTLFQSFCPSIAIWAGGFVRTHSQLQAANGSIAGYKARHTGEAGTQQRRCPTPCALLLAISPRGSTSVLALHCDSALGRGTDRLDACRLES